MGSLRIVVVEDDAIIATLFEELLGMMGHQVCASVASEADAVVAARTLSPDLMIVDEWLNPGSGVTAMHTILKSGHVPHVYVTTNIARVRDVDPGAVIVSKPFREAELVNGMRLALSACPRSPGAGTATPAGESHAAPCVFSESAGTVAGLAQDG